MTFLGDEGRDALAVKRMIVDHKLRLIGPVTSVGNMYLGPLYYYLMLPAMMVSFLSPVGPAVMVALLGILTTALIYFYGREWIGNKGSLAAALLYAVSPVIITFSRSSWNPNVMPFFAILSTYGIWRVWQRKQFFWLAILGVTLSFALQSHWLGLLLLPTIFIFWLMSLIEILKSKKSSKSFWLQTFLGFLAFLFLAIAPLVWFDLRHNYLNSQAFLSFINESGGSVGFKFYDFFPRLWNLSKTIFTNLVAGKDVFWGFWLTLIISLVVVLKIIQEIILDRGCGLVKRSPGLFLLLVWFLTGILGLSFYHQNIYDHYFGFLFPVPFLLVGWLLGIFLERKILGKMITVLVICGLLFLAVKQSPLRYQPNKQLQKTESIAAFVLEKANGQPFNLALVAERNYDEAYAFFMEKWGQPPTRIDPQQAEQTITSQLFVICEQDDCQPTVNPKAEIAMFGWSIIDEEWQVEGVKIYKLSHNPDQK